MANVSFAWGNREGLPESKVEGRFLVSKDEHALYLDVDGDERIRFGDFVEVETFSELESITDPVSTALYYVKDANVLAKHEAGEWKQINPDTGAVHVTTEGDGNAVTGATYDADSRTLKLTLGKKLVEEGALDGKIGEKIGEIAPQSTVKDYVDAQKSELQGSIDGKADKTHEHEMADVTGLEAALAEKATTEDLNTQKGRIDSLTEQVGGLSGAMHYKGTVGSDPTQMEELDTYKSGDVVIWGEKEYVFDGEAFHEFGDVTAEGARIKKVEDKLDGVESTVTEYVSGQISGKADKSEVTALVGEASEITAGTIKEAAKEAEDYAKTQDAALKQELEGKITDAMKWGTF